MAGTIGRTWGRRRERENHDGERTGRHGARNRAAARADRQGPYEQGLVELLGGPKGASPLHIWGTLTEVNEILQGGMDLHSWSSGTFDFAADDRKPTRPGGDPATLATPARPGGSETREGGAARTHHEVPRGAR